MPLVYYTAMLSLSTNGGGSGLWSTTLPCFPCLLERVGVGYGLLHRHAFHANWRGWEWGMVCYTTMLSLPIGRRVSGGMVYYTAMFSLPTGGVGVGYGL